MKREAGDFRDRMPKPVRRVPLAENPSRRRVIGTVLALVIAAGAFFAFFQGVMRKDPGWQEIKSEGKYASQFTLLYNLGQTDDSPSAEMRKLQRIYTLALDQAGQALDASEAAEEPRNLAWLNTHPNVETEISSQLYASLESILSAGRWLYLGPLYEMNESMLASQTDAEAAEMDPRLSEEAASFVSALLPCLSSNDHIQLKMLENNQVVLFVSADYLQLGKEYGISRWIDFGWMRNAFAADSIADILLNAGASRGILTAEMQTPVAGSSFGNQFIRALCENDGIRLSLKGRFSEKSDFQESGRSSASVETVIEAVCRESAALISLNAKTSGRSYRNGELRTPWVSTSDGLDSACVEALLAASRAEGCAPLLLHILPILTGNEKEPAGSLGDDTLWLSVDHELMKWGNTDILEYHLASGQE